jgi:hypothetical protein
MFIVFCVMQGPIYFMWGTDWEDQPLINARRLTERLPKELIFDWKSIQPKSRIQSMFKAVSKVQPSLAPADSLARVEDAKDLPQNSESPQNQQGSAEPELEDILVTTTGEEFQDEPTLDSIKTLSSVELSRSTNLVTKDFLPKSQHEDPQMPGDMPAKQGDLSLNLSSGIGGSDVSSYGKSTPRKASEISSGKVVPKVGNTTKKPRTVSNATPTPTITSFFKRA